MLPDSAIINRLATFCEVVHHRRGKFREPEEVFNGVRHYRVKIRQPIPSYLRFGRIQVVLKHQGQEETCRHCNLPEHYAHSCNQEICYNCDNPGHQARSCPQPILCSICHSDSHKAKACPHSWCPTVRVTKSRLDQNVEIVDDTTPPYDASDFNPFSVLPQDEGTTNLAPSSSPPPVPDPISQVTTPAASPPSPPTEYFPLQTWMRYYPTSMMKVHQPKLGLIQPRRKKTLRKTKA